jgi:hypothetical protein
MDLLKANTRLNGFVTIELHEVALSDSDGTARFTVFEEGSGGRFIRTAVGGRTRDRGDGGDA